MNARAVSCEGGNTPILSCLNADVLHFLVTSFFISKRRPGLEYWGVIF